MTKPTFLKYDKPLLCAMIQCNTPEECIAKIKRSLDGGAEAIGVQLCKLRKEYRTKEIITGIFNACEGRPIYVTSYRTGESQDMTDDERVELSLLALECGATLIDIMGDTFDRSPQYELAEAPEAIAKQKALIEEIHRRGGEVLISSHTHKSTTLEENIMIAKTQIERGADVIKIVNKAQNTDEIITYLKAIEEITKMTDKKLLLLVSGEGLLTRYIGPNFGACMYLCVESYNELDTKGQPLLSKIKAVRDNIIFQ